MSEHRKLAAILAADVVGFSRMAGADEDRTLARLRALRSDLIDPTVSVHNGRVVKRTGDGALVEFRSVVDAVRCAIEIQNAMVERNSGVPPDRRIEFRIGIHLGDVVEESDGDLMGDGVNIAARLEGIAQPGAICLSEDAYRQVKTRLDVSVSDLGPVQLKNITEPLGVFALQVGGAAAQATRPPGPQIDTGPARDAAGKASVAVLPFTNMTNDPEQEYFVDGMVEDIITALSHFKQLSVIARNSTFIYKGQAVDIRKAASDLGARYILEGGVRKAGNRLRITGQLIDAETGAHLWADRYDGNLEDVFDLQDDITASVVGAIEPTLRKAEIERARRKPADNLGAYDLFLRAQPHVYAVQDDENLKALDLLNKAMELDPDYGPVLAHAAWCLVQRITRGWPPAGPDDVADAVRLGRKAIAVGSDDAVSMALGGFALVTVGRDYAAGMDAVRHAIERNPGSGFVNAISGCALVFGDDGKNGLQLLDRAIALGPSEPGYFNALVGAALQHLFDGRPEQALELAQRSATLNSSWETSYWVLAMAHAQLGQMSEARSALADYMSRSRDATVSRLRKQLPIRNPKSLELVLDNLRKAGLPE